ncbi:uncharacterized protein LOC142335233 [Convolutriloba macropyga]|uniref:uncharacterized protein LOC142335233 n=1 Tax=Convolutriloba macropyga TaxID=536237 RepID=UPI003F52833E
MHGLILVALFIMMFFCVFSFKQAKNKSMKFLQNLSKGVKDAMGFEKRWEWGDEEMIWFHKFEPSLGAIRQKIEKRAHPYWGNQAGVNLIGRAEFVELCRDILGNIFGLTKREMMDIKFDEVFDTHLRNQDKAYGDNLDVLCFIKCLVSPFREPSNFFYWFALCDTNCSGGLDNLEFQRLIDRKFPKSRDGSTPKVRALADQFFPQDQSDNVLTSWWKKIAGEKEVRIEDFVKAFPQDLLQECTCYDIIVEEGL